MPNAKDVAEGHNRRLLLVGPTGSGKTSQIWTLPGRRFAYIFDPNSLSTLQGCDLEYEKFTPDVLEMDMTLKGFNKGSRSDAPKKKTEPRTYMAWLDDFNRRYEEGFFRGFDWLCLDSLTFITKAIMDRQLFINGRYGDIEELADYRVVGSKMADIFGTINGMDINIFATGHIDTYQDEDTKKVRTQLMLPGKARKMVPLQFTDIWLAKAVEGEEGKGVRYVARTVPDPKGLLDIRCSIPGLDPEVDVTIGAGAKRIPLGMVEGPTHYGVGKILQKMKVKPSLAVVNRV